MNLSDGLNQLGLSLSEEAGQKLLGYLDLLEKWNKVYNLTAVNNRDDRVTHHLLDSLAILPVLQNSALAGRHLKLADVGSGAGLPGLILAIAKPEWQVTSIEVIEKKIAFQRQVKIELDLSNVSVYAGRVENLKDRFDMAIARAFSSLPIFVRQAGHLADRLWAMKGMYPAAEVAELPADWKVGACHEMSVPGISGNRCVMELEKN